MTRTGFLRWLVRSTLLSLLGAGLWFGWGAWESHRFEQRLEELRAAGRLPTFERLMGPPTPAGENGYALFLEAVEAGRATTRRISSALLDRDEEEIEYTEGPFEEWSPAQRDHERTVLTELTPVIEALDRALAFPVIEHKGKPPLASGMFFEAGYALQIWTRLAGARPESGARQCDRMIRLMECWRLVDPGDTGMRAGLWRVTTLPALQDVLGRGGGTPQQGLRWQSVLAEEEGRLLEGFGRRRLWKQAAALWLVSAWRHGDDPMSELREKFAHVASVFDKMDIESLPEDTQGQLKPMVSLVDQYAMARPPFQSWWERPRLHALAQEVAYELPDEAQRPWDVPRLRAAAGGVEGSETRFSRKVLHTLAALRAALAALAVGRLLEDHEADAPFPSLDALRAALPATDPMSGEPFDVTVLDEVVEIRPPSSAVWSVIDDDAGLHWRVPRP